jgi:CspA family cold shock protein
MLTIVKLMRYMYIKIVLFFIICVISMQFQIYLTLATAIELNNSETNRVLLNTAPNYQNISNSTGLEQTVSLQNCLVKTGRDQIQEGRPLLILPLSNGNLFLPSACNTTYEGITWLSKKSNRWNALVVIYSSECNQFNSNSSPALAVLEAQMSQFNCSDGPKFINVKNPYPGVISYCKSNTSIIYCGALPPGLGTIIEYCGIVDNNTLMLFMSTEGIKVTGQILKNLSIMPREERDYVSSGENIKENHTAFTKLFPRMFAGLTGAVKFFNKVKRFGFIAGDDGCDYVFYTSGLMPGISIDEGDWVIFDVVEGERGLKADRVTTF